MTIYGWDASHYDGVPDGARVVSEGFSFMTHKAGGDANDDELAAWWSALKGQRGRLLLGAYWVLYPGSAAARADSFIARLDDKCPGWRDGPFLLQADCELWNGDSSTKPGKGDIKAFCDRLVQRMPKLRPVVYASKGQYGDSLGGVGYPLWNANYPSAMTGPASAIYEHVGGDSGRGWVVYSGQMPVLWQFSSSATIAGQTTSDANAYRGTLGQLNALVAPGWTKTQEVEPEMELTTKIGDNVNADRDVGDVLRDIAKWRGLLFGDTADTKNAALSPKAPLAVLLSTPAAVGAVAADVDDLKVKVAAVESALTTLTGQVGTPPVITQEQLNQAMLNALITLAGGQS